MAACRAMFSGAEAVTTVIRGTLLHNEPMVKHCSWRCGGVAKNYCTPADLADLQSLMQQLPVNEAILFVGLGSNLLVRDGGFNGTVIATQGVMNQLELTADDTVHVGAGVTDARLARFCARNQFEGGGFFAGIPGVVGGALAMNAGAFGGETWRHVTRVQTLDRNGQLHTRTPAEYDIGYRHVKLKHETQEEWFVSANLRFARQGESAGTSKLDIKQLLAKRAATQPTGSASCGSVFRNPEGDYAARLIENCGLKGSRIGGAVVSEKHANFIINEGSATAADIERLIEHVQKTVFMHFGIALQTEVRIVGEKVK